MLPLKTPSVPPAISLPIGVRNTTSSILAKSLPGIALPCFLFPGIGGGRRNGSFIGCNRSLFVSSLPDACGRLSPPYRIPDGLFAGQWFDGRCRNAPAAAPTTGYHRLHPGSLSAVIGCGAVVCRPVRERGGMGAVVARVHAIHAKGVRSYEGFRLSCVLCTLLSLFMVMPASVASAATEGSGGSGRHDPLSRQRRWAKPFACMSRRWCCAPASWRANGWRTTATAGMRYRECAAWIARAVQRQRKIAAPPEQTNGVRVSMAKPGSWKARYDSMPEGREGHFYDGLRNGAKARLYYYSGSGQGPLRGQARPCMRTATDGIPRLSSERNPLACCSTTAARDRLRQAVRKAI